VHDSLWFTTRSSLFRPGDEAWEEIVRYEQPLRRLLTRRYARALSQDERDDLLQEILLEIKETLTKTFDRDRGKFRALLQTVVNRRVIDRLRRAPLRSLPAAAEAQLEAPPPAEYGALDLEAALVEAVAGCRDHFSGGTSKDLAVLHTLTDRLVHGASTIQIAKEGGVSRDRIGRLLAKGREVIFQRLLTAELGFEPGDARLDPCVAAFKRMLRKPAESRAQLEQLGDSALSDPLEDFWKRFQAALPRFQGDVTAAGRELAQGVELILGPSTGQED
jgi:DNA-directed RNA polymerase specialized sigma24 family protein